MSAFLFEHKHVVSGNADAECSVTCCILKSKLGQPCKIIPTGNKPQRSEGEIEIFLLSPSYTAEK